MEDEERKAYEAEIAALNEKLNEAMEQLGEALELLKEIKNLAS